MTRHDVSSAGSIVAAVVCIAWAAAAWSAVTVTVGPTTGDVVGSDHLALQKGADLLVLRAPDGNGVLAIAAGTYTMDNALNIRGPMIVRGAGMGKTILRKGPQHAARLAAPAKLGNARLVLDDASWLRVGQGVTLRYERNTSAWGNVIRTVMAIDGNTIELDRPPGDEPRSRPGINAAFGPPGAPYKAGAIVQRSHPLISATPRRWHKAVEWIGGIVIEDLTIDGDKARNADMYVDGCRNGGIYLHSGRSCAVRRVEVKDFAGDGLSWQLVHDVTVEDCVSTGNGTAFGAAGGNGYGFHPGTGSLRTVVRNCVARGNGDVGLFVCWNIHEGRFERNLLEDNGNHGISVGHDDGGNEFADNAIRRNGHTGVWFRRETPAPDGCIFRRNTIEDNGAPGRPGFGVFLVGARGTVLTGNTIRDTRKDEAQRTQTTAIYVAENIKAGTRIDADNRIEGPIVTAPARLKPPAAPAPD